MRLTINEAGEFAVDHPFDFRRFSLRLAREQLRSWSGEMLSIEADRAWIDEGSLRRIAGLADQRDWQAGLSAMIAYAARNGWVDAQGRIRAHIEWC